MKPKPDNLSAPISHANALLAGVRLLWEQLGLVIGGSFLWTLSLMVALAIGRNVGRHSPPGVALILDALLSPLFVAPAAAALTFALHCAASGNIAGADRLREGAKKYTLPFAKLLLGETLVSLALLSSSVFYLRLGGIGYVVGTLSLYLCGAFLAFALLVAPVFVAQEEGVFDDPDRPATRGVVAALRRSVILFLAHPFLVFLVALMTAALLFLCVALVIPFAIFWIGAALSLMTAALRVMLIAQGILPDPTAPDAAKER